MVIWGWRGGCGGGGEGEMGIWLVETVMWRVVERGMWGVGIFAYFAKHGELWERVEGELALQGNPEVVGRGIWGGGDLCLFCQAWRVVGESGGGIGIAGEPGGCREGDLGGGDLCLFCQARRVVGESGGGIGIIGEPARCSVSVFLLTFKKYEKL